MSCPERACSSAAPVNISLSPCEVMKSIVMSTFSFSAHSWQSLVSVSLAPGTQWSQKPTESFPAAKAPRTKGVAMVVSAAVCNSLRRVSALVFMLSSNLPPAIIAHSSPYGPPALFRQRRFDQLSRGWFCRGFVTMWLVTSEFVDRVRQQAILDLSDSEIAEVVDKIAPGIVQSADPGDKGD